MTHPTKAEENQLRFYAKRQGLRLEKCRARYPLTLGAGTYRLIDQISGDVYAAGGGPLDGDYGLTFEQVAAILAEGRSR